MSAYLTVSSLLNFLASILLVTFISSSVAKSRVRRCYLYFLLSVTGWSGSYFLWQVSAAESVSYFFCQALTIFSILIPITLYHFCTSLAGLQALISIRFGYAFSVCLIFAVPYGLVVSGVSEKFGHTFWPDAGVLMPVYLVYFSGYVITSGVVLINGWKLHVGRRASDNLFVLLTCLVGFLGGATNFPLWYDIPIQPYGNILVSVYIFLLGYGLYSNRIQGFGVDFYKASVGFLLNLAVALFYLLSVSALRISLGEDPLQGYEIWVHGIGAFLVGMVAFWGIPLLKNKTEKLIVNVFQRERVSALATLSELPLKLSHLVDSESICHVAAESLEEILEVDGASVFLLEPFSSTLKCAYSTSRFPRAVIDYEISAENALLTQLSELPECVSLDQVYDLNEDEFYKALVNLKNDLGISVIVPIFASHEIYGLIFLRPRLQVQIWSEEELTTLYNVGVQIGLNIRVRDFERRSSEVDKLVALGTMAAGLSHEIRNPLVSVQTLGSLLSRQKSLDEMPEEFRSVLVRDIKRIESIVDGVAVFSKNQTAKKSVIKAAEVIDSSVQIFKSQITAELTELRIESSCSPTLEIFANFDQLVQVLTNLLENAHHAIATSPEPAIEIGINVRTVSSHSRISNQWIEITVSDNGSGIPLSIADRIFDPFITSKDTGERENKKGMGLGLAISKRIIENHDGAISVSESKWGGAKFTVSLKVFEALKE